jgi:hypothetical protein
MVKAVEPASHDGDFEETEATSMPRKVGNIPVSANSMMDVRILVRRTRQAFAFLLWDRPPSVGSITPVSSRSV